MKTVLTIFILLFEIVSAYADTISSFKYPNYHIQFGMSSINFMDGYGNKYSRIYDQDIRTGDFSITFSKYIKNDFITSISYYRYDRNDYMKYRGQSNFQNLSHGEILSKHLRIITINLGKTYLKSVGRKSALYCKPFFELSYRFGSDDIFLGAYPGGFDFASVGVQSKGLGLGTGVEIGVIAFKHLSLSATFNYNYTFGKGFYEELSPPFTQYYKYSPPRNMLVFQPKIGFLF